MMPAPWRPLSANSGIISGQINFGNTIAQPKIEGAAQLLDLKIPTLALTDLNANLLFHDHLAEITDWHFRMPDESFSGSGRLTTRPPDFTASARSDESCLCPGDRALGRVGRADASG